MAILQGISGMQIGDGAGGKVALSIKESVLRILSDTQLSFMTATVRTPGALNSGTVSYYVPELVQTENYGTGTNAFQTPQAGLVSVNIDTRRSSSYEIETFDMSRIGEIDYIIGMVSTGLALAIQADLNAHFLNFLKEKITGELTAQRIKVKYIGEKNVDLTPENSRKDLLLLEYQMNDINQTFDKAKLGVPKAEVFCIFSPLLDTNIRNAFWNQPNGLGEWVIDKSLSGKQIGNIKYFVDNMLNKNIPAGSSFSKDKDNDFSKILGFILHNEAVAFPINIETIGQTINTQNLNPRWIAKYQFGMGVLRPSLIYAIEKDGDAIVKAKAK